MQADIKQKLKSDGGFSLLELLVAVAVLSLAAVTLLDHQASAARMTGRVQEQALAAIVAENRLALLSAQEESPAIGSRSGTAEQFGVSFRWAEVVRVVPGSELMSLDVTVTADGSDAPLAKLTAFRRVE